MKKLLTILLTLAMIMISMPSYAEAQTNSREEADLYISSARELNEFATKVNNGNDYSGKVIKLTNDIVYDSNSVNNFVPIGKSSYADRGYKFNGTFDGAGYSISGIDITDIDGSNYFMGLFGSIAEGGVIKNLTFKDSIFTSKDGLYIGAIAGCSRGIIDNCYSDIEISVQGSGNTLGFGKQYHDYHFVGGIAGYNYGIITNCNNATNMIINTTSEVNYFGGIVGRSYGTVSNSSNTGSITVTLPENEEAYTGGIVGYLSEGNNYTVQNCYNAGLLYGDGNIAGIVGYAGGIVSNSYCSIESASKNIFNLKGAEKNNKALSSSDMKLFTFTDTLNANRSSNSEWLKWVNTSQSEFPTLIANNEVTFKTIKNGLVSSNYSYAYEGQTVVLTVTANAKYKISKVLVTTKAGKKVTVTKKNGKYQFKMPSEKVVVSATFKKK